MTGPGTPMPVAPEEAARAEAVLGRLQLLVTRKLDGLLQGDYAGLLPGPGTEAGESREYRPGDDVRRMDWPVTARTTQPHVRRTVADRELETWLAVDLSASLDFGTAQWLKRDLVIAAATAMAHLTVRGGNRRRRGGTVVRVPEKDPSRGPGWRRKPAARPLSRSRRPRCCACPHGPAVRRRRACSARSPGRDPAGADRPGRPDRHAEPSAAAARGGRGDLRLHGAGESGRGR